MIRAVSTGHSAEASPDPALWLRPEELSRGLSSTSRPSFLHRRRMSVLVSGLLRPSLRSFRTDGGLFHQRASVKEPGIQMNERAHRPFGLAPSFEPHFVPYDAAYAAPYDAAHAVPHAVPRQEPCHRNPPKIPNDPNAPCLRRPQSHRLKNTGPDPCNHPVPTPPPSLLKLQTRENREICRYVHPLVPSQAKTSTPNDFPIRAEKLAVHPALLCTR